MIFVVIYGPGPAWPAGVTVEDMPLTAHLKHLKELFDSGKLLMGGPFADSSGMTIIEASSEEEVRQMVAHDPDMINGTIALTSIRVWHVIFNQLAASQPPHTVDKLAQTDSSFSLDFGIMLWYTEVPTTNFVGANRCSRSPTPTLPQDGEGNYAQGRATFTSH